MVTSPQLPDTVHWKEDTTSGSNQACVLNSFDRRDLPHQISRHACFHRTASSESVELLWGCPVPRRMSSPFGASALSNTLMDYWSASYHQENQKQCQLANWLPVQTSRSLEYIPYFSLQWNGYSSPTPVDRYPTNYVWNSGNTEENLSQADCNAQLGR